MNEVKILSDECKGCQLCIEWCPKQCIIVSPSINKIGYQFAEFKPGDTACTACGICFYVCPEPGTITVIAEGKKSSNE